LFKIAKMNGANGTYNPTSGFLSFNAHPPRVYITAEDDSFDEVTIRHWKEEGFEVAYIPMGDGGKDYAQQIKAIASNLSKCLRSVNDFSNKQKELGEYYALVAYGEAAETCLTIATKPMPHCCALVCYYPDSIPHPNQKYPSQLNLVVHLAESQGLAASFPTYIYPGVEGGFAEHDLDLYDAVASNLAWSRSLAAARKGFKIDVDLDTVRDTFSALTLTVKDATRAVAMIAPDAHVNHIPTGTGGVGQRALLHFYRDFFVPCSPPSLQMRLISRTSGVNSVVDELLVSFKHTHEISWLLPGIPATNRLVQIPVVSIVGIRGGKLVSEHVYWDQASVLVQIGALDPKFVPKALSSKGVKQLPIMGVTEARKVMDINSVPSNRFISRW
jgi:hypothetical protein